MLGPFSEQSYAKKGKDDPISICEGDTKSKTPIKPRK